MIEMRQNASGLWPEASILIYGLLPHDIRMVQDSESRSLDKVIVRLPDGMRDRLKAAAESNKRSMNAEIVARLEQTFPPERSIPTSADAVRSPAMRAISEKIILEIEAIMEKYTAIAQEVAKDEAAGAEPAPAKPRSRLLDL